MAMRGSQRRTRPITNFTLCSLPVSLIEELGSFPRLNSQVRIHRDDPGQSVTNCDGLGRTGTYGDEPERPGTTRNGLARANNGWHALPEPEEYQTGAGGPTQGH